MRKNKQIQIENKEQTILESNKQTIIKIKKDTIIENKKELIKKIFFGILIIIWMAVVFNFSSQQSKKSSNTSQKVIKTSLSQVKSFKKMEEPKQNQLIEDLQHPTRKLAHFSIYTIGGIIIFNFINTFNMCNKKKILITILIGFLYATTDEIHQLFIDGRSGQITDVLIDTAGICFGCSIVYFIITGGKRKNGRQRF